MCFKLHIIIAFLCLLLLAIQSINYNNDNFFFFIVFQMYTNGLYGNGIGVHNFLHFLKKFETELKCTLANLATILYEFQVLRSSSCHLTYLMLFVIGT